MGEGLSEGDLRIADRVHALWRARGVPQAVLGKAAGLTGQQVSQRLGGKARFTPDQLFKVLEAMDVDVGEFYAGLRGGFHAEHYLAGIVLRHERQVKTARHDRLRRPPSRPFSDEDLRRMAEGLEELRFVDTEAARRQALDILRTTSERPVADSVASEARLTLASFDRRRGNYGATAYSLMEALRFAGPKGALKARALQAVMSLAVDLGDFEEARAAVQQARAEFRLLERPQGVGRTWISEGLLSLHRGETASALDAYKRALPLISDDNWIVRYAALHGLVFCRLSLGELDGILENSKELYRVIEAAGPAPRRLAEGLWLRGEALIRTGHQAQGTEDLRRVLLIFRQEEVSQLDLVLISLRLACLYKDRGHLEEFQELTCTLVPMLETIARDNRRIAGLLTEIAGNVLRGELPRTFLTRIYREVLKGSQSRFRAAALVCNGPVVIRTPKGST